MADPGTTTNTPPSDGSTTPSSSGNTDPSILSDIGTIGSSALQFLGSPAGGQIVTGGVGMYEAGQANKQIQSLYAPIQTTGGQFTQAGQQTLAKTQPALTASIPGQTQFATEQQGVAAQYGTGNLTTAQNAQLQAFTTQQKSMAMAELARAGITDPNSTQAQTKMREIDNAAMMQAQQMVQGNQQIATGAQTAVQGVYDTLLNQSLATAGLGTNAQLAAAKGIIAGDQQISSSLNTLLKGISSLTTTAQQPGGVAQGQQGGGTNVATSALSRAGSAIKDIGSQLGLTGYGGTTGFNALNAQNVADLGTRAAASGTDIQNQAATTAANWQPDLSGLTAGSNLGSDNPYVTADASSVYVADPMSYSFDNTPA